MSNVRKPTAAKVDPSIVLLEDYPALASAITSALRKFAPQHTTHTAHSLKELESMATQFQPALLVIDVDPPWSKLTQSLGKMRHTHPATRALVIGATVPGEIIDRLGSHRALQFLQKTFDVPEFGAAIQALLGPWTDPETEKLRGTLRCFDTVDAALLQCASGRSVVLEVKKNASKSGELHFVNGQLRHAENGRRSGIDALEELFSWKEPELREKEGKSRVAKRSIDSPWTDAFLAALPEIEPLPAAAITERLTPPPPKPEPKPKTGRKIVLIDDTDMLLLFVEDVLATAEPNLRISAASSGKEGVATVAEVLPDLVLLDYSLPDFNGDEVCRRLLQNERTAKIPVLMMSGHVPEMNRTAAELENVVATIAKPFLSDALVALVRETLESPPIVPAKKQDPGETLRQEIAQPQAKATEPEPATAPVFERSQRSPAAQESVSMPAAKVPAPAVSEPVKPAPPPEPRPAPPIPIVTEPPRPPIPAFAPPPPPSPAAPPPSPEIVPIEHPVPHVIDVAPVPVPRSAVSTRVTSAPLAGDIPVLGEKSNEIVLGLFLEVVSLQLTPSLRMGMLRARPSSQTVSLQVESPALRAALPPTGFQLGAVDLDRHGRIAILRVKPTVQPFMPMPTRGSLQIGSVAVVPNHTQELLQLTPTANGPMRMQLIANLETTGVELTDTFQIANIVLRNRGNQVRVTFSEQAVTAEKTGTICEISGVQIDNAAQIVELTLQPV